MGKSLLGIVGLQPNQDMIIFGSHTARFTNGRREKDALLADTELTTNGVDIFDGLAHSPEDRHHKAAFLPDLTHKRFLRRLLALRAAARQEAALRRLEDGDTALVVGEEAVRTRAGIVPLTWLPDTKLRNVAVLQLAYHPPAPCSSRISFWLRS